jgi:hypothetical protein
MVPIEYHDRFKEAIAALPDLPAGKKYQKSDLIWDRLHLFSDRGLDVYYAPFHHLEREAQVALVGLTPGFTQMEEAFRAAKAGKQAGLSDTDLYAFIDRTGSFSGPMRFNLVRMLDGIGLNERFGVASCLELFSNPTDKVHFTSAVSAPIFKGEENYNGSLVCVPALRNWLLEHLADELAALTAAVIIPLGKGASEAVDLIASKGVLDRQRCLTGFPHPSGANGHAKRLYEAGRQQWRAQIKGLSS